MPTGPRVSGNSTQSCSDDGTLETKLLHIMTIWRRPFLLSVIEVVEGGPRAGEVDLAWPRG